jgi:hypothetical protein
MCCYTCSRGEIAVLRCEMNATHDSISTSISAPLPLPPRLLFTSLWGCAFLLTCKVSYLNLTAIMHLPRSYVALLGDSLASRVLRSKSLGSVLFQEHPDF